ncbi:MAG: protein kinase [Thiomargarita sp.]|nr:protein kinase [Thiomargarita sp.]
MNLLLPPNTSVKLDSDLTCTVGKFIGGGGQGEVYQANFNGKAVALKWYFAQQATSKQRTAIEKLITSGAPNDNFLWPLSLATIPRSKSFGYIMPLREHRYKSINDLMKLHIDPSFRALATAGLELAHSFLQLHAKGLCYQDISFGNVFFEPNTGEILICDNDNVMVDGHTNCGVLGTPRFMAPEIIQGNALPNTQTDLFSLGVLLFYILMVHHPLEGKQESDITCFDLAAMNKLYGSEALFIFDPDNRSNRPIPGYHDNALIYWQLYPQFLRDLFIKAFTIGITDPENGRVRESEWRSTMVRLRDSIILCTHCQAENFYDVEVLKVSGKLRPCWSCKKSFKTPPRIRISRDIVMLNQGTQLFPHHIDPQKIYDFSQPIAMVIEHSKRLKIWGLKNLSSENWDVKTANGATKHIKPMESVTILNGTSIHFGKTLGGIRF